MSDVLNEFYQQRPELRVQANDGFLIQAAEKPLTVDGLSIAAARLQESLALIPAAQRAWDEYRLSNRVKAGTAFRAQFLEQWRAKELQSEQERLVQQFPHLSGRPINVLREAQTKHELVE